MRANAFCREIHQYYYWAFEKDSRQANPQENVIWHGVVSTTDVRQHAHVVVDLGAAGCPSRVRQDMLPPSHVLGTPLVVISLVICHYSLTEFAQVAALKLRTLNEIWGLPYIYDVHKILGFLDPSPLFVRKIYTICPQIWGIS